MTFTRDDFISNLWRVAGLLSMAAVCLALSGCGNGLAQVSGQVMLNGQPLRGGKGDVRVTVQFQPADGVGAVAIGLADENGNYEMATGSQTGIRPGEYVVTCSASELVRPTNPNATPGVRLVSDPKYANANTSGLRCTVQPGTNEFNISLESPPKTASRRGA